MTAQPTMRGCRLSVHGLWLLLVGACGAGSTAPLEHSDETGTAASDTGDVTTVVCGESGVYIDLNYSDDIDAIEDCTRLLGTLRIGDSVFVSIDGLESIDTIDETLILFRNSELASVQGLSGLELAVSRLSTTIC